MHEIRSCHCRNRRVSAGWVSYLPENERRQAMIVGYARVSTADQNLDRQQDALYKYGIDKLYYEKLTIRCIIISCFQSNLIKSRYRFPVSLLPTIAAKQTMTITITATAPPATMNATVPLIAPIPSLNTFTMDFKSIFVYLTVL